MDETGETIEETVCEEQELTPEDRRPFEDEVTVLPDDDDDEVQRRKYYVDGGHVEIAAHLVYELDPDGKQLRVVRFTDYTAEKVRTLFANAPRAARGVGRPGSARATSSLALEERGIDFTELAEAAGQPDADPFDLLCHLAFNAPLRTRRERAHSGCAVSARTSSSSTARGAPDPRRPARQVHRARHRAVRGARRARGAADQCLRQRDRDRQAVRRRAEAARRRESNCRTLLYAA